MITVQAEKSWASELLKPRLLAAFAAIGVFSYSLYLTHELVIMQSWWFVIKGLPPMINTFLIVTPATIVFAWLFFLFFEKPFMRKAVPSSEFRVRSSEFGPAGLPASRSEFGASALQVGARAESEL